MNEKDQGPVDQRSPHSSGASESSRSSASDTSDVMLTLVREMGAQREAWTLEQQAAAKERRSERRWRMLFQSLFFGAPILLGILYFLFFLSSAGFKWGPWEKVVGVVNIEGKIDATGLASADKIIPALEQAFSNKNVQAVVLKIDSPGGAPVEAERIYSAMAALKKKYPKPVVAVINNLAASAAYMIAMHADQVVAGKYSLVGSIGAIMETLDLSKAMAKLEVSQRVYASGNLKSFLNPFVPPTAEGDKKANDIVNQMGKTFVDELRSVRGKRLNPTTNYATGELWGGSEALSLGLVDKIGTLDEIVATNWGLKIYNFGPSNDGFAFLSSEYTEGLATRLENWFLTRALNLG